MAKLAEDAEAHLKRGLRAFEVARGSKPVERDSLLSFAMQEADSGLRVAENFVSGVARELSREDDELHSENVSLLAQRMLLVNTHVFPDERERRDMCAKPLERARWIMLIRERTGLGLKDAQEVWDDWVVSYGPTGPSDDIPF
jgi:hypothetical protein